MKKEKTDKANQNDFSSEMLQFIEQSPTCFHATKNIKNLLCEKGFSELSEQNPWKIKHGERYFVTRGDSSIIAFALPQKCNGGFAIVASHTDSPALKIKEGGEKNELGVCRLNVEKYGGLLLSPWFDRPLSVAGRVAIRSKNGKIEMRLADIRRPLALIPSLAIHFDRNANDGKKIDFQNEMLPVFSEEGERSILDAISEHLKIKKTDILATDLFVYNAERGFFWGAQNEFLSSPRLDDLECAWTTLQGFLDSIVTLEEMQNIPVYATFDNEEVGSMTRQGADSTFLSETLERISISLKKNREEHFCALARSFLVSADNAHALHPAHAHLFDPVNRPLVNKGIVAKLNAAQKYTTDSISLALFKDFCQKAAVPLQIFTNNSNVAGGSTLGNISQTHVSVRSIDVGLPQWAMHSPLESAGAKDPIFMKRATEAFFKADEFPLD